MLLSNEHVRVCTTTGSLRSRFQRPLCVVDRGFSEPWCWCVKDASRSRFSLTARASAFKGYVGLFNPAALHERVLEPLNASLPAPAPADHGAKASARQEPKTQEKSGAGGGDRIQGQLQREVGVQLLLQPKVGT